MKEYPRSEGIIDEGVHKPLPHGTEYATLTKEGYFASYYRFIEETLFFWSFYHQAWQVSQRKSFAEHGFKEDRMMKVIDDGNLNEVVASIRYSHDEMTMAQGRKLKCKDFRVSYKGKHFYVHQEDWDSSEYVHVFSWLPNRVRTFEPDNEFRDTVLEHIIDNALRL